MTEKKKWTAPQERQLLDLIQSGEHTLSWCFMKVARSTDRSPKAVAAHYYNQMKSQALPESVEIESTSYSGQRRWTEEEDKILLDHLKAGIGNFSACFHAVAEEIERTPIAVAAHWYAVLSRRTDLPPIIITASEKTVQRNRKNGKGIESTPSIWRRLLAVLRNLPF